MGVKIDSRKVRTGEKWIFGKITNMTAGARPLRWVGSYTLLANVHSFTHFLFR